MKLLKKLFGRRRTLETELAGLRSFFNDPDVSDGDKYQYYCVLSAIRGPDFEETSSIKDATTAVIRDRVFGPSSVHNPISQWITLHPDSDEYVKARMAMLSMTNHEHFSSHAGLAFAALGLKWMSANDPTK